MSSYSITASVDSERHTASPNQRSDGIGRAALHTWNSRAKRISPCELRALLGFAADAGITSEQLLAATRLQLDELDRPLARISMHDQLELQRRACEVGLNAEWAVVVGSRMHLTSYGLVGYAMLSSRTLASALALTTTYQPLLHLKHDIQLESGEHEAVLTFRSGYALEANDDLPCAVLESVKMCSLIRDLVGSDFHPKSVSLRGKPAAAVANAMEDFLGCQVEHGDQTQIRFSAASLATPLRQFDVPTHRGCIHACDKAMAELLIVDEMTACVRATLETAMPDVPSMAQVASNLCLSPRSLRRRLTSEGTSYNEILDVVRRRMSERLLADTDMTIESIAELLGYGDAANFRHAFKRWTGESPRHHRQNTTARPVRRAGISWAKVSHLGVATISNSEAMHFKLP